MSVQPRNPDKDVAGGVPNSDGAVRELEKTDVANRSGTRQMKEDDSSREGDIVPLGKERGGAPEDAVKDSEEARIEDHS